MPPVSTESAVFCAFLGPMRSDPILALTANVGRGGIRPNRQAARWQLLAKVSSREALPTILPTAPVGRFVVDDQVSTGFDSGKLRAKRGRTRRLRKRP